MSDVPRDGRLVRIVKDLAPASITLPYHPLTVPELANAA